MPIFRHTIANVSEWNAEAVLAFSHILVINSLASQRNDERLLLVESGSADAQPSWLYFLRCGCVMLCNVWASLLQSPINELATMWERSPVIESPDNVDRVLVEHLESIVPAQGVDDVWNDDTRRVYREATVELGVAFSRTRTLGKSFTTWDALSVWPMRISVEYMNLLSAWHPGALVLLAHYCILLRRLEIYWYFDGTATKLLATVLEHLEPKYREYVERAVEQYEKHTREMA